MGHGPVLIPDATMFIQLALFLASYWVLKSLVFKPYLELLEERRAKTVGLQDHVGEAEAEIGRLRQQYESQLHESKKKLNDWYESERRAVLEQEREILAKAQDAAAKEQEVFRANLKREEESARRELQSQVDSFASAIASKLLGKKVEIQQGQQAAPKERMSEESVPG